MRVESVRGVGEKLAQKLRAAGYPTAELLALADPREISSRANIGLETAIKVIRNARKSLKYTFLTGTELEKLNTKTYKYFTTGTKNLDNLLGGGIRLGRITEFYGAPRSGKTQLVHQLSVTVQLPTDKGGMDGMAAVIDTEGTFSPKRVATISKRFNLDPVMVNNNVFVAPAATSDMLLELVYHDLPQLIESKPIKLIAIDSLTSTFRAEYVGLESLRERQQVINKLLHYLLRIAIAEKIAVVITNQVIAQTQLYGPSMVAAGGYVVGHMSTYRVQLRRKGSDAGVVAKLEDAPDLPERDVMLQITDEGIIDYPEKK
ncbi:MAG: DNA repair and recombination protein RadA [Candidatus Asgardarchaeia archaeon]